jgi:hypothetical protein
MIPEAGQIWHIKKSTRPDVEVVRYDEFSKTVHWKYVDSKTVFNMELDVFLRDFQIK